MKSPPVLILGAGINGASLARDLALNGVSCWVVDRRDIACGATSKSSRLIHGGLRYLEYGEFRLVREALRERDRLLRLAPQFVRPLTFAIPIRQRGGGWVAAIRRLLGLAAKHRAARGLWLTRAGLRTYDWFSRGSPLPRHSVRTHSSQSHPRVSDEYRWVCRYTDAQMAYPERYTVALLRDAQEISAAQGLDFRLFTHHDARRTGATVELVDLLGDAATPTEHPDGTNRGPAAAIQLQPRLLVNATGAWGDTTLAQLHVPARRLFGGTKGSHFLTAHESLRQALGPQGVYAETSDGRFVFILPLGRLVLVGTTDDPFADDPHRAVATADELNYLFTLVRNVFPDITLTATDIVCHYSGVRPLPYRENLAPGAVSRDHHVELSEDEIPVLTLIGGKLTTSRQLAEQVGEMVLARLGLPRVATTRDRVIPGGAGFPTNQHDLEVRHAQLSRDHACEADTISYLDALCGNQLDEILAGLDGGEREPISGTLVPRGFARWVIRHEWVRSLSDLVERRLMLVLSGQVTEQALRELAELLVEEGLLEAAQLDSEVAACRQHLTTHYGYFW